jgi:acyl-coenzyme A synthetase/AMP-(fatty) acid ligase
MRERCMGKGASLGKEAVLADSGWVGEISAWVGRVRKATFSTAYYNGTGDLALRWEVARVWRLGRQIDCVIVSAQ